MTQTTEIESQGTNELVQRYVKDILYDIHTTESKIQRSSAGQELIKRGQRALVDIADKMQEIFRDVQNIDYEMLMAFVSLIRPIMENKKMPEEPDFPYAVDVPYGKQDPQKWIDYCFENKAL
jgi:hypothetical protein